MTSSSSTNHSGTPSGQPAAESPSGVRLLLICHGEGMQNRYAGLGSMNSGLTARGWEEVVAVASWLSTHESIRALYSGPLLQSRLTAQRIGQAVGQPVSVLREPLHGASIRSNPGQLPDADSEDESLPQSENDQPNDYEGSASSVHDDVLQELLVAHPEGTIAIVASADNIRSMLTELLQSNGAPFEIDHTGLTGWDLHDSVWSVAYVNRREHLPRPVLRPQVEKAAAAPTNEQEESSAAVLEVYNRVAREDVVAKAADDRERIRSLLDFGKLPAGLNILDVGSGLGVLPLMLAEEGAASVIGVDISPGMLEQAELLRLSEPTETTNLVSYRLARLQSLPFPEGRFDAVTCRLVLNHFRAPERIVREFVRVLKPGGIFLMAELLSVDDPVKRATQNAIEERRNPSHVAARSAEQYDKIVVDAGLEIVDTASVSVSRNLKEWLDAYRTPEAVASTVIEMVEAGLETDAAGIGARRRGDRIEFQQRMYYLEAVKPTE